MIDKHIKFITGADKEKEHLEYCLHLAKLYNMKNQIKLFEEKLKRLEDERIKIK